MDTLFGKCPECGTIHPPVIKGQCPVAAGKMLDDKMQSESASSISLSISKIIDNLTNSKDPQRELRLIESVLNIKL